MLKFCSLFSGSNGNCHWVSDGQSGLLVDAGMSGKRILSAMKDMDIDSGTVQGIVITHEHADHIKGAGILSRMLDVPVYANEKTWEAMERELGQIEDRNKRFFVTGHGFHIGDIGVKPFAIPHDAAEPVGFSFFAADKKITVATDLGHVSKELYENLLDSNFILLEANHDIEMVRMGPYPWYLKQRILGNQGHLSNDLAGKLVAQMVAMGTERILLGHLSKENNFPELAYQTVKNVLEGKDIQPGKDLILEVAVRERIGEMISV